VSGGGRRQQQRLPLSTASRAQWWSHETFLEHKFTPQGLTRHTIQAVTEGMRCCCCRLLLLLLLLALLLL
jgi:hypothetical protein